MTAVLRRSSWKRANSAQVLAFCGQQVDEHQLTAPLPVEIGAQKVDGELFILGCSTCANALSPE
jgi:hypothetical protein